MNLRTRLAVLVAVSVGVGAIALSVVATVTTRDVLRDAVDRALEDRARREVGPRRPDRPGRDPIGAGDTTVRIFDEDGVVVEGVAVTPATGLTDADLAVAAGSRPAYFRDGDIAGDHVRILTVPAGDGRAVQLARSVTGLDQTIAQLTLIYTLLGGAGVAAAGLVGWAVARRSLRPVDDLTEAVERVATDRDLSSEIEIERHDEIGRLADRFNEMLRALRTSRQQQHQLISDASHELRTPLTSLRTNVDVLDRLDELSPEDRVELFADLRAEMAELSALVAELVDLATEEDQAPEPAAPVRLDALVARLARRTERRTGCTVRCELEPTTVLGRASRLERAVANLFDNAAKWSPEGGAIDVRLADGALVVSDEGPGIDEADLARVFDRFYRADTARSRPGSGLGLAIVRQVVEDHGGRVLAGRAPGGGAAVGFRLPPVAAPEPDDE
ncbi:MAG: HAMP domain-containing histidine kinase [Acidimicrobiales bacterium]|nr:HAMP domain-containing histidine kinase [Acidimicrobiales bacterium]